MFVRSELKSLHTHRPELRPLPPRSEFAVSIRERIVIHGKYSGRICAPVLSGGLNGSRLLADSDGN